jgi:hypothetical protein
MTAIASYAGSSESVSARAESRWAGLFLRLLGAFLVATAAWKAFSPADGAALQAVHALPGWLLIAVVQAELGAGLWLLSGIWPQWSWRAAAALFVPFAVFSLFRALAGFESCGCFGSVRVNPWITFTFDMAILGLLATLRGTFARLPGGPHRPRLLMVCTIGYLVLGVSSFVLMYPAQAAKLGGAGELSDGDRLVILEPAEWAGRELPVAESLMPAVDLSRGNWVVVFYHHGCPRCVEAVSRYIELASESGEPGSQVLLVEVPPYAREEPADLGAARHVRLSDRREWFVQTPVEIRIEHGKVTGAHPELPSVQ